MKKSIKILGLALLSIAAFSCTSDDEPEVFPQPQQETITQIAVKTGEFSTLVAALKKAGLDATLNEKGTYTVFAPTNKAFEDFLLENKIPNLDAIPVPLLKEVLLNHVLSAEVFSDKIANGYVKTLAKGLASSTNPLSMYLNKDNGVKINGVSTVTQANIDASNGVIHKVDKVINLPTIVTHAAANPNFTNLVAALTRMGNTTKFVEVLNGTGPFTVFAPTNTAFGNFLTELGPGTTLASIPEPTLDKVLKYHVVGGANVLSSTLMNNQVVQTFAGMGASNAFTVLLPPARLKDSSDRECAISAVDVQCANGVIHVLDKVLLPK